MILSFKVKSTAAFAAGEAVREFSGLERQAYKRMEILWAATGLGDLRGAEFWLNLQTAHDLRLAEQAVGPRSMRCRS